MSMDHEAAPDDTFDQAFHENLYRQAEAWRQREEPEAAALFSAPALAEKWLRQTDDGWIRAQRPNGEIVSLPSYLKVAWLRNQLGRDFFIAAEGLFRGVTFSLPQGNLVEKDPHHGAATCAFRRRTGGPTHIDGETYDMELEVRFVRDGKRFTVGPHPAKTSTTLPTPSGTHVVQIPDYPHQAPAGYGRFRTVWFRIGAEGDRYIHPGRLSDGCITCAPRHWPEIYGALVVARRAGDRENVGEVAVA